MNTFQQLQAFRDKLESQPVTLAEFKEKFYYFQARRAEMEAEADKMYTIADIKKRIITRSDKKADMVSSLVNAYMRVFNLNFSEIWSFGQGKDAGLIANVEKATQKDLDAFLEAELADQAARKAKNERLLRIRDNEVTDAQELADKVYYFGLGKLSPTERRAHLANIAQADLKKVEQREAQKATVKQVQIDDDAAFELHTTKHTKTGADVYVVKLNKRVDKEQYQALNTAAKRLGGYYSSFNKGGAIPGFLFSSQAAAEQFMGVKDSDQQKDKSAKIENTWDRLNELAEGLEEAGREKLNQERQTNTARRQRMAASAEYDAEAKIYKAKVLKRIVEGIKAGKYPFLQRISAITQYDSLHDIFYRARYKAIELEANRLNIRREKVEITPDQIVDQVKYPGIWFDKYAINTLINGFAKKKGAIMLGERLKKLARNKLAAEGAHYVLTDQRWIEDIEAKLYLLDKWERERFSRDIMRYNRIRKNLKLESISMLRAAIYELIDAMNVNTLSPEEQRAKKLKELERSVQLDKVAGFFPTPTELANELADKANLEPGLKVLEPSAGIGHIAEALLTKEPGIDLTLIEYGSKYAEILREKGFEVINQDFLEYDVAGWDRIVMNPPFENNQDIAHIEHAYSLLKPGGELVAIMANRVGQERAKPFFKWLDTVGYFEKNEEGAFKSAFRPTGVNTITVVIEKPASASAMPEIKAEKTDAPAASEDTPTPLKPVDAFEGLLKIDYSFIRRPVRTIYAQDAFKSAIPIYNPGDDTNLIEFYNIVKRKSTVLRNANIVSDLYHRYREMYKQTFAIYNTFSGIITYGIAGELNLKDKENWTWEKITEFYRLSLIKDYNKFKDFAEYNYEAFARLEFEEMVKEAQKLYKENYYAYFVLEPFIKRKVDAHYFKAGSLSPWFLKEEDLKPYGLTKRELRGDNGQNYLDLVVRKLITIQQYDELIELSEIRKKNSEIQSNKTNYKALLNGFLAIYPYFSVEGKNWKLTIGNLNRALTETKVGGYFEPYYDNLFKKTYIRAWFKDARAFDFSDTGNTDFLNSMARKIGKTDEANYLGKDQKEYYTAKELYALKTSTPPARDLAAKRAKALELKFKYLKLKYAE